MRGRKALAALATCATVAGTALVVAGAVGVGEANTVPGQAVAAAHAAAGMQHANPTAAPEPAASGPPAARPPAPQRAAAPGRAADPVPAAEPAPKRPPHAATATTPAPPDRPPEPPEGPPEPPRGQRPGTIRLAHGGTAALVRAEVTDSRTLTIPDGVREAAWWGAGLGARSGATVFAGHVNWSGSTGPFDELWRSRRGDPVAVRDTGGRTWRYRVSRVLTLDKDDLAGHAARLFGQDGRHRVVLVTCGGRWLGESYASNRIVVAEPAR